MCGCTDRISDGISFEVLWTEVVINKYRLMVPSDMKLLLYCRHTDDSIFPVDAPKILREPRSIKKDEDPVVRDKFLIVSYHWHKRLDPTVLTFS